jgi:hypothetical protein
MFSDVGAVRQVGGRRSERIANASPASYVIIDGETVAAEAAAPLALKTSMAIGNPSVRRFRSRVAGRKGAPDQLPRLHGFDHAVYTPHAAEFLFLRSMA